jgi:predicted nucleic acid-binding protein
VILLDTSVVIDYVRGKDTKLVGLLPRISGAVCGMVRAELLCGARDPSHRINLLTLLSTISHLPILDSLWDKVGDNLATLRSQGITVPFPDAVIATLGVENDLEVGARDHQYPLMQNALPRLKLFQEPP